MSKAREGAPAANATCGGRSEGARAGPTEASRLVGSDESESSVAPDDNLSTSEELHGPTSGVRLRGDDASPTRQRERAAIGAGARAAELDACAFWRTLEIVALLIPFECG